MKKINKSYFMVLLVIIFILVIVSIYQITKLSKKISEYECGEPYKLFFYPKQSLVYCCLDNDNDNVCDSFCEEEGEEVYVREGVSVSSICSVNYNAVKWVAETVIYEEKNPNLMGIGKRTDPYS